jgi:hypothetical protein
MSPTGTIPNHELLIDDERYLITVVESRSAPGDSSSAAQTTFFQRALTKFELAVLPMTIAAAFVAPGIGSEFCRTVVRSQSSRSSMRFADWEEDVWFFTEEASAVAEIRALNELLALPVAEGFSPELNNE